MARMMAEGNESEAFNQPKCAVCNLIETAHQKMLTCGRCKKTRYCSKIIQSTLHARYTRYTKINFYQARAAKQTTGKPTSKSAKLKTTSSKSPSSPEKSPTLLSLARSPALQARSSSRYTEPYKPLLAGRSPTPTISRSKTRMLNRRPYPT